MADIIETIITNIVAHIMQASKQASSKRGLIPLDTPPRPSPIFPLSLCQVPLHVMVCNRDDASLLAILEHGNASRHNPLQIDAQDKHGDTPLHLAVAKAQVGTIFSPKLSPDNVIC
jgi:hypothetical protein